MLLTSTEGESVHYYIVLEYPNLYESQNEDLTSKIVGELNIEESGKEYEKPSIVYTATTSEGNGDWYKSVNIGGTISGSGTSYTGLYCISNSACTPNQTLTISNKTFNVSLGNSTSAQMLCTKVVDENNQSVTSCSNAYKVDGELPTTTIAVNTSTAGDNDWYKALTLKISATDTYSEVEKVLYCTTTSSSCTPTTSVTGSSAMVELSSNASTQVVCAKSIDGAGNESDTVCSDAYKVDKEAPTGTISASATLTKSDTVTIYVSADDANISGINKVVINGWYGTTWVSTQTGGTVNYDSTNNRYYVTFTFSNIKDTTSGATSNGDGTYTFNAHIFDNAGNKIITSKVAVVLDQTSPTITTQPSNQSVVVGGAISMKVVTSDNNATYQWQYRTSSSGTWTNASEASATTANYTTTSTTTHNGYQYRCILKDALGNSVTTNTATATVVSITSQPTSATIVKGAIATFDFGLSSTSGITYQWQSSTNGTSWTNIAGNSTAATIKLTGTEARNGWQVRCVVTDQQGNSIATNGATFTVISITTQPSNKTVTVGTNATFSIALSSTSGITYQWQFRSSSSGTWANSGMTGNTTSTITVGGTLARNGYQYRCIITDKFGNTVTSNVVTLTVVSAKNTILANMTTITTRTDFDTSYTSTTTGTIFTAEDDDGTSYYFAGAPTDNYVKFANKYWRIIRINGDGTIRMIFHGVSLEDTTGEVYTTGVSVLGYFTSNSSNSSVNFNYLSGGAKTLLATWYTNLLADYSSYIDVSAGFCNDKTSYTDKAGTTSGGGTGTYTTYYGGYVRTQNSKVPTLKCENSDDLFTTSSASKGNKLLTYPIGLITMDEVAYAGSAISGAGNWNYYLYFGTDSYPYWTMTPSMFYSGAKIFYVHSNGALLSQFSSGSGDLLIRPVINLRADVTLSGAGTSGNPYTVS